MNKTTRKIIARRKRRIKSRLEKRQCEDQPKPMFAASNIHYEVADRTSGVACGGIGVIHKLARQTGLIEALDENIHLLKVHLPYHESDHILNMAYNILCGGKCLEDIELLRNDEVYLNALDAERIPDPTTAGDFCRRFTVEDIHKLMDAINEIRIKVWRQQPDSFFDEAIIDVDGIMAPTTGECKKGMDISYKGQWGYHPLVVSLSQTNEVLFLVNRSGNRPSHEDAARWIDKAVDLCRRAGFRKITVRGDTDFSQTTELDRWDAGGMEFIFGIDAMANLVELADSLQDEAWKALKRRAKYEVKTFPRRRPTNVKEEIVVRRRFKNIRLDSELVAEFDYQPCACSKAYRMVVVCKNLTVSRGEDMLFDEVRYFFYITNNRRLRASDIVFSANDRCNQENLNAQLKGGVFALRMPVDTLESNWAYMVIASLAWTLKSWVALLLPETGRWKAKYKSEKRKVLRMEFRTFLNAFIRVPCQIVRQSRKIIYRLLSWNPWQEVLFRIMDALSKPLRC
ncbi:MAG: IS1380 family transposase [Nitrospiraceae bacterium]|nr:IS1380 family transposase [Nitrospiraceae bacterium]